MSSLTIETDVAAFTIRQYLDSGRYAMAAAQANADLDYTSGLVAVVSARSLASFILTSFKDTTSDDYRRFRDFNHEAMKLIDLFWHVFKLLVLAQGNGTARVVQAEVKEPPKHLVKKSRHKVLPDDIRNALTSALDAGQPSNVSQGAWFHYIAEEVGVGDNTVMNYFYRRYKNGK